MFDPPLREGSDLISGRLFHDWVTLTKAKENCEEWRKSLVANGFTQSDFEL
jgi:hypothetical protein